MAFINNVICLVVGFIFICWAAPLSKKYNAWTTRVRERHPNVNPPPTPEWRSRNTRIMTILFRIVGMLLLGQTILRLISGTAALCKGIFFLVEMQPDSGPHKDRRA